MIAKLSTSVSSFFQRTAPDPFVLAVLLTFLTIILALTMQQATPTDIVAWWSGLSPAGNAGLWNLLAFAMQMCLILITGHALASAPVVSRFLSRLASLPRSPFQAVALVAFVAMLLALLNWGLGLIAGAILARRVGIQMHVRGIRVHYPLLAAAGYLGLLVWHGGFSGSAPLSATTTKGLADAFGPDYDGQPIPLSDTIFSPLNLTVTLGMLVCLPLLMAALAPRDDATIQSPADFTSTDHSHAPPAPTPGKPFLPRLLEDSPIVTIMLLGLIAAWALYFYFPPSDPAQAGLNPDAVGINTLGLNQINLTMLALGLLLHRTPMRYVAAVEDAARSCSGIILQFPLYAGIMAIMKHSGLTADIAGALTKAADQTTAPIYTFLSAAIVNVFVPSGGGQWSIQGPIALDVAAQHNIPPGKMLMAVAFGDQLTNMLQPFWALPLLAITGVKARDIVGYTALIMLVAAAWMITCLLLF